MRTTPWILSAALVSLLTACGGGGGGGSSSTPTPTSTATSAATSSPAPTSTSTSTSSVKTSTSSASSSSAAALAFCANLTSDPDGDGTGLENGTNCKMRTGFDITAEMKVGWNLGNTMDATGNTASPLDDETYWGNPKTTKANMDALKAAGFNTLRLPVSWDDHMSGAEHTIDTAWLDRVEEIAKYALDNGMYVIVNIHHNNGWEMPTAANEANAKDYLSKMWPQIANRFQKYDHHLILETMNEPRVTVNGTDDWWGKQEYFDVLNRLNAVALKAIRDTGGNNAKRLVMIPGYVAGANDFQLDGVVLPNDKMIALSTHAYTPYDFALNLSGTSVFNGEAELDQLFARINTKFIAKGIPVVMGEWAAVNKDNLTERVKFAEYYVKGATKYGIPTVLWDNGNFGNSGERLGFLRRDTNTWEFPTIIEAIMRGLAK